MHAYAGKQAPVAQAAGRRSGPTIKCTAFCSLATWGLEDVRVRAQASAPVAGGRHEELADDELHGVVLIGDLGIGARGEPPSLVPSGLLKGSNSLCFGEYL